ncbi:MAG TPA: PadR family transcriptional regulator [Thermoleophilaceae bacterium]|nr:PadR family transcriptional regulator [Thermoleophilaceae bacterium]
MAKLSTKHVVLGLVIERPGYGYGLQQRLSERLGFLDLAESAVYKTLARLEEDGLVEEAAERRVAGSRPGQRILYKATAQGVDEFKSWMAAPTDRAVLRDELQTKLALANPSDLPQLLVAVEEQSRSCLADLEGLRRGSLGAAMTNDVPWPVAARMMVDDFKARWLEAMVAWLDAVSEVIETRVAQDADRVAH